MNIILPLVVLAIAMTVIGNVSSFFVDARKVSRASEMQIIKMDAAREMGAVVRAAYDLRQRVGAGCNPTTRLRNSDNGVALCWPTSDNGCFEVSGMKVCRSSGFVALNSSPAPHWVHLLLPSAFAQRTLPGALTPGAGGGSPNGVRLSLSVPSTNPRLATTFSPVCAGPDITCITVSFCVDHGYRNGCTSTQDIFVSQTYAVMNF